MEVIVATQVLGERACPYSSTTASPTSFKGPTSTPTMRSSTTAAGMSAYLRRAQLTKVYGSAPLASPTVYRHCNVNMALIVEIIPTVHVLFHGANGWYFYATCSPLRSGHIRGCVAWCFFDHAIQTHLRVRRAVLLTNGRSPEEIATAGCLD